MFIRIYTNNIGVINKMSLSPFYWQMLLIINENSVEHAIGIVGDTKTDFKNVFAI